MSESTRLHDSEFHQLWFRGQVRVNPVSRYLSDSEGYELALPGYGDIVQSKHPDIIVGDRIYGFLPIASHITMIPGDVSHSDLRMPVNAGLLCHRFIMNTPYQIRARYAPEFEEAIMLQPLFGTSFLMQSYCEDHDFYGAKRIVVTSASAKTAMGLGICA